VQVRSCGTYCGQSGTGAGFLRVLRFSLPILIQLTAPHHLSSGAGTIGQVVADVPSRLSLTPPQETKKKLHLTFHFNVNDDGCDRTWDILNIKLARYPFILKICHFEEIIPN
jgi:hypothetical protein